MDLIQQHSFQLLIDRFKTVVEIDADDEAIIKSVFKLGFLKKGDYFQKSGQINDQLGFINKGLVRYFVLKNDEESTIEFSCEGEFIAEYQSLVEQSETIQYIQVLEDTELLVTNKDGLMKIYSEVKKGNEFGRIVLEYRFNHLIRQLLSIYMHNPEQRYMHFIKSFPNLLQRVPQYYIASYVGVKPQSLSRIRKRIAQQIY